MRVLEDESRNRLGRFNQKDVSMVFSSVMRLHPSSPHPLVESCLSSLERHLEKERHPQTLFLLLSYYRLRAQALQGHPASDQQLINNRKILRLVRHTLGQVSAMREHELALLDEMLALCAQEANNKALEAIFSSQLFYENRQERFIRSMAGEGSAGGRLSPPLVAASCACAALRLLPTLWSRWVHPAPCRGPVLQCRQPKQEVLCAVPTHLSPPGCPFRHREPTSPQGGQRVGVWGVAVESSPVLFSWAVWCTWRDLPSCLQPHALLRAAELPGFWLPCLPLAHAAQTAVPSGEQHSGRGLTPGCASLCRVASQEGREPDPLHHGPHCQVRGPAPAA